MNLRSITFLRQHYPKLQILLVCSLLEKLFGRKDLTKDDFTLCLKELWSLNTRPVETVVLNSGKGIKAFDYCLSFSFAFRRMLSEIEEKDMYQLIAPFRRAYG